MLYGYDGKHTFCRCRCDCGNEKIVNVSNLKRNKNISCGCMSSYYRSLNNSTNEIGQKYGRLTIIDINRSSRPTRAICLCDCGNVVVAAKSDVVSLHTQSCGCLQRDRAIEANTKDFSGITANSGVIITKRAKQNKNGVWLWECICPLCGQSFIAMPAKILSGHVTSCGCKTSSSTVQIIEKFLIDRKIKYTKEFRFNECKDRYTLPFDFAIFTDSGNLLFLIEYDGEQHFHPVELYGGQSEFERRRKHDKIKTDFCEKSCIPLIRFNYKDNKNNILKAIEKYYKYYLSVTTVIPSMVT